MRTAVGHDGGAPQFDAAAGIFGVDTGLGWPAEDEGPAIATGRVPGCSTEWVNGSKSSWAAHDTRRKMHLPSLATRKY
jgi:hypothetical protein